MKSYGVTFQISLDSKRAFFSFLLLIWTKFYLKRKKNLNFDVMYKNLDISVSHAYIQKSGGCTNRNVTSASTIPFKRQYILNSSSTENSRNNSPRD